MNEVSESRSVVSDSLQPHGLYSPWNSPGQNTRVGSLSLLQRIITTQGSNPGIKPRSPALQVDSLQAEPQGKSNTGVGNLSLLQGIFQTQELKQGLLPYRRILYQLSYQEKPIPKMIPSNCSHDKMIVTNTLWLIFHFKSKYTHHLFSTDTKLYPISTIVLLFSKKNKQKKNPWQFFSSFLPMKVSKYLLSLICHTSLPWLLLNFWNNTYILHNIYILHTLKNFIHICIFVYLLITQWRNN